VAVTSEVSDPFPARPVSIDEALGLREKVETFDHTAPLIGLARKMRRQATASKSVIGIYVGFGGGIHLFGFEPETADWESVSTASRHELPDPTAIQNGMSDLMSWLSSRYPGKDLVVYENRAHE
jgi:hypothetical protein